MQSDTLEARFAPDGSGAEFVRRSDGVRVASLCPVVYRETNATRLSPLDLRTTAGSTSPDEELDVALRESPEPDVVAYDLRVGEEVGSLTFRLVGDVVSFELDAPCEVCAPIVRVLGDMTQATLPGVEFLERGERSSSTLDVNPEERARFAPPCMWVTAPFAVISTDRVSATLIYDDPNARPIFAVPDALDGDATTSRFNVVARRVSGELRLARPYSLEESILQAVRTIGLPEPPSRPRTSAEEDALYRAAFESRLKLSNGWASAVGSGLAPDNCHYGTDFLSTIWELTGTIPKTPRLDVGGAYLRNYASFFVLDRVDLLAQWLNGEARNIRAKQRSDGSFRYSGDYLRGSSVDYASGDSGRYLYRLLDHWRLTGNRESLAAGLKGLAFVNNLKTPRGAQTWELSLHTPDLVAAAWCAYANALAYEATSDETYLSAARRWALDGLPFVYLWRAKELPDDAVMLYATIPALGTTNWIAPCWIGAPVQWR